MWLNPARRLLGGSQFNKTEWVKVIYAGILWISNPYNERITEGSAAVACL